jgi:hypothetical protein
MSSTYPFGAFPGFFGFNPFTGVTPGFPGTSTNNWNNGYLPFTGSPTNWYGNSPINQFGWNNTGWNNTPAATYPSNFYNNPFASYPYANLPFNGTPVANSTPWFGGFNNTFANTSIPSTPWGVYGNSPVNGLFNPYLAQYANAGYTPGFNPGFNPGFSNTPWNFNNPWASFFQNIPQGFQQPYAGTFNNPTANYAPWYGGPVAQNTGAYAGIPGSYPFNAAYAGVNGTNRVNGQAGINPGQPIREAA